MVFSLGPLRLRNPFAHLLAIVVASGDLKSMLCLVVVSIVLVVLAYLTNPSENSFRAYLTEQSFRLHLRRLSDASDDEPGLQPKHSSQNLPAKRGPAAAIHPHSSAFHFANRASVSLRTPKHVFHSFGVFTIAAMVPITKSDTVEDRDPMIISDSWYVGTFGRWWRGGIIEAWYHDVVTRSKDEESWSSGILAMKTQDRTSDYDGLPFSTKNLPPHLLARGSPPKLRNRERPSHKPGVLPTRSSTPPPLPKSVSLPLHAARIPPPSGDRHSAHYVQSPAQSHPQPSIAIDQPCQGSPSRAKSQSTLFDQSPLIAELLRQVSLSKASVLDLRIQLTDCQSTASQSHAMLQGEVDSYRDRKRQEDSSRVELKSRTKILEDSKRAAESTKRDAEKKLKVAQTIWNNANKQIGHLDKDINHLQDRLHDDETFIRHNKDTLSDAEQELGEALEHKKQEIKLAEDVMTALNIRAKELEEKLSAEREKLKLLRERMDDEKQDYAFQVPHGVDSSAPWASMFDSHDAVSTPARAVDDFVEFQESPTGSDSFESDRRSSLQFDLHSLPRPAGLPVGSVPTLHASTMNTNGGASIAALRANGYSIFDDALVSINQPSQSLVPNFQPFDADSSSLRSSHASFSPMSPSMIPAGLMTSLDKPDGLSRSFQSESDAFMEREWRSKNMSPYSHMFHAAENFGSNYLPLTGSPTSMQDPSVNSYDHDPFEVRILSSHNRDNPMDMQRVSWLHRTQSDPSRSLYDTGESDTMTYAVEKPAPRRWFSTTSKDKPKKGLNPDAKVFSLSKHAPKAITTPNFGSVPSYDALNPNGLGTKAISSASNSLLRAFAPSPAEREALQRALGGSTNTSFERLPSLSDVGSIPSSPTHVHAHSSTSHMPQHPMGKVLPSWLQSLPRIRKVTFSPWEDEEPTAVDATNNGGVHRSG